MDIRLSNAKSVAHLVNAHQEAVSTTCKSGYVVLFPTTPLILAVAMMTAWIPFSHIVMSLSSMKSLHG